MTRAFRRTADAEQCLYGSERLGGVYNIKSVRWLSNALGGDSERIRTFIVRTGILNSIH